MLLTNNGAKNITHSFEIINNFWEENLSIQNYISQIELNYNNFYSKNIEFVVFDTETKWFRDDIIEIGALICKNNQIRAKDGNFYDYSYFMNNKGANIDKMDKFAFFVKPKVLDIPAKITELTNINLKMILDWEKTWETFPNFAEALIAFIKYVDWRPLVAHNAKFDTWIFKWSVWNNVNEITKVITEWKITIEEIENFFKLPVVDTLVDAKNILKVNPANNHKNGIIASLYGLKPNEFMLHRAYYDVIFTTRILYGLIETGTSNLKQLQNIFKEKTKETYYVIEKRWSGKFGQQKFELNPLETISSLKFRIMMFLHEKGLSFDDVEVISKEIFSWDVASSMYKNIWKVSVDLNTFKN